ncbi:MAG: diguanylate cyclase, partial [Rhodobacteraceae bacterium]|nr:diguanylate cyclase [Paracoccaceae bacterium]
MNSISAAPPAATAFSPDACSRLGSTLLEQSYTPVAVMNAERRVVWGNAPFAQLVGMDQRKIAEEQPVLLDAAHVGTAGLTRMVLAITEGRTWHGRINGTRENGGAYVATTTIMPIGTPGADAGKDSDSLWLMMLSDDTYRAALSSALAEDFPLYKHAIENATEGLVVIDQSGCVAFCNTSAADMLATTVDDLIGRNFGFAFGPAGQTTEIELVVGGAPKFVEMNASAITWDSQDATLVTLDDVTARRTTETQLDLQAKAMASAANGIFITDERGVIQWANAAMEAISGYAPGELIGRTSALFRSGKHPRRFYRDMWTQLQKGEVWRGRTINRHQAGHLYTAEQVITPVCDATGRISQYVSIQEDISERLKAQDEIIRLAQYDTLTDLPNRHLFMERLGSATGRAKRSGEMLAVMIIDLDNFKIINTNLGHDAGDSLLVAAKERLMAQLRTTDTLARLGGDEFGVLLEGVRDATAASQTIRRIFECFAEPIVIGDHTMKAAASAGVAMYPKDHTEPAELMSQAELAMYQAKSQGRHTYCYFDSDADIRRRINLEKELHNAIAKRQLWLAYQPQVDLASGRVVGAEALIRWSHPERGLISPVDFIPLAESSDLILSIGEWIIAEICRQNQIWRATGLPKLQLGFNVSGVQFRRADLHAQVMAMLKDAGLDADAIDIEVTETVAMERSQKVQENFGRLTEAGISISMDDFG